jgi:hypothetical protein
MIFFRFKNQQNFNFVKHEKQLFDRSLSSLGKNSQYMREKKNYQSIKLEEKKLMIKKRKTVSVNVVLFVNYSPFIIFS